ncbi:MAG: penicillin-binding transpeptidase domain-containing protein, partial [Candidatus Omnitrophota bacterium]
NTSEERKHYLIDDDAPLFNRAISGEYPPGSVFKLITALAGLSTKKINPGTQFFCPGEKLIGRRSFKCWSEHATVNLKEAIVHSCNVYFYTAGILTTAESMHDYAKIFNLGKRTGIDLPQESAGFLPSPRWQVDVNQKKWYQGDTANMAIGQGGLLFTPLQVVRMVSAIANSGYLVRPHLIRKVAEKKVIYKRPSKINVNPKYLLFLREAMRQVVEDEAGTAHNINFSQFPIAAKTGTAQIPGNRKHGWIAGFGPFNAPQIAFVIFIEDSQGGIAASEFAREFFKRLSSEKLLSFE